MHLTCCISEVHKYSSVFRELIKEEIMMVYFDDIIILAADAEEVMDRLSRVLSVAGPYGLQISWKKCQFICTKIV